MDGKVAFANSMELESVTTKKYSEIAKYNKPKIDNFYSLNVGWDCFFSFRVSSDETKPDLIFFCVNSDETDNVKVLLKETFVQLYYNLIIKTNENTFSLSKIGMPEPLYFEFYDALMDVKNLKEVQKFYTRFNEEGVYLSEIDDLDPQNVKYSFRYDQMINCRADESKYIKDTFPREVADLFSSDQCCAGYTVEWNMKPLQNFFCSEKKSNDCALEIKLFKSFMFNKCMDYGLKTLKRILSLNHFSLEQAKMSFTTRSLLINVMKEINMLRLEKITSAYFKKEISIYKQKSTQHLYFLLRVFSMNVQRITAINKEQEKLKDEHRIDNKQQISLMEIMTNYFLKMYEEVKTQLIVKNTTVVNINQNTQINSGSSSSSSSSINMNMNINNSTNINQDGSMMISDGSSSSSGSSSSGSSSSSSSSYSSSTVAITKIMRQQIEIIEHQIMSFLGVSRLTPQQTKIIQSLAIYNLTMISEILKKNPNIRFDDLETLASMPPSDGITYLNKLKTDGLFDVKYHFEYDSEKDCDRNKTNSNKTFNFTGGKYYSSGYTPPITNNTEKKVEISLPISEPSNYQNYEDFNSLNAKTGDKPDAIDPINITPNKTLNLPLFKKAEGEVDIVQSKHQTDTGPEPEAVPIEFKPMEDPFSKNNTGVVRTNENKDIRISAIVHQSSLTPPSNLRK